VWAERGQSVIVLWVLSRVADRQGICASSPWAWTKRSTRDFFSFLIWGGKAICGWESGVADAPFVGF